MTESSTIEWMEEDGRKRKYREYFNEELLSISTKDVQQESWEDQVYNEMEKFMQTVHSVISGRGIGLQILARCVLIDCGAPARYNT